MKCDHNLVKRDVIAASISAFCFWISDLMCIENYHTPEPSIHVPKKMRCLSGRGTTRAENAQRTPTQSHISPSILVYEEKIVANRVGDPRKLFGQSTCPDEIPSSTLYVRHVRSYRPHSPIVHTLCAPRHEKPVCNSACAKPVESLMPPQEGSCKRKPDPLQSLFA